MSSRFARPGKPARWPILAIVALIVGMLAGGPAIAPPKAHAEPRSVTFTMSTLSPFTMVKDGHFSGFTVDVWNEIARRNGWTTVFREDKDVPAQFNAVDAGDADVAGGAISITAERTERFDFSQPTLNAGLQIMVPDTSSEHQPPGLVDFLKLLFAKPMLFWLLTALALALIPAHLYWFFERRHSDADISTSYFPGIFQAMNAALGSLIAVGDDSPRHWLTRTLTLLWAFVGVIFVAFYTATLTAHLTVEKFDSQIQGPKDLYGKKVATVANTTSAAYLDANSIASTKFDDTDQALNAIRQDYDAVVFDAPVLRFFLNHQGAGAGEVTGPIFEAEDYGFAFRLNSELRKPVNAALLAMREDGTYDRIKQGWFGDDQSSSGDGPN
ncbi:transporter substrate-binding domain-containing protein [Gordonia sp. (in: high G+C Gram-positive bacteria)]|uniref:transporter substrate-binding domain-containing protein n=1 Tax=Gordonia sp. (in: high G+C Gram-positive bacteria) TaxID=84139 RepID=UPI0039E66FDF